MHAIKSVGATVKHIFVIFDYGTFPQRTCMTRSTCPCIRWQNWSNVVATERDGGDFGAQAVTELKAFPVNLARWSEVQGGISEHL